MSLLQNEEFLIWQLRTSYLVHNKDGVGERLINVDSTPLLNDANLRVAIQGPGVEIQRTYSPPIPVATAVASEYFAGPSRSTTFDRNEDDEEDRGIVSGRRSVETVGPRPHIRRRRQREQEDDDSSDLSDESDEEAEVNQRNAVQQIRFAKMPVRTRAGSSPLRTLVDRNGPELTVTEASRPDGDGRLRRGSLGAVEAVKQRARRDTTTSSDMSSENELDPSVFKRRPLKSRTAGGVHFLQDQEEEDENLDHDRLEDVKEDDGELSHRGSQASSISSFVGTADSESLLDADDDHLASSPLADLIPPGLNINNPSSPKKSRTQPGSTLQALPPARPISTVLPVSALGQAIRARQAKPTNPVEPFTKFSGKGEKDPLNIKIYAPFSEDPEDPFEMPVLKVSRDPEARTVPPATVADTIGLCLWTYREKGLEPAISREKLDVNWWTMRMVDDGEVEYDFPALNRSKLLTDFTSNNNAKDKDSGARPARGRARGKAFDEFALVEATEAEYKENQMVTPRYTEQFKEITEVPQETAPEGGADTGSAIDDEPLNTAVPKPFAFASRKGSLTLDQPNVGVLQSTPRTGPPKLLKIHFTSLEAQSQTSTLEETTDTYLAEVLDTVCKRWKLDKSQHFLKIAGTNTIAPLDRQVESMGPRSDLDLVRRRFAHEGPPKLAASPSSASPNAPILLTDAVTSKKGKKVAATNTSHPLAQNQDAWSMPTNFKRYTVVRKQPMSFTPSHTRTLILDGEYLYICPPEIGKTIFDTANAKTTTVPFTSIYGCKTSSRHPKVFRVMVYRGRENKRYDFEASSASEASEIVAEISRGMGPSKGAGST